MKIIVDIDLCYGCKSCQLACSFHHTKSFWPDKSNINVSRNFQTGIIKWHINSTCDGCIDEEEPLCIKYCVYKAIKVVGNKKILSKKKKYLLINKKLELKSCFAGKILQINLSDKKIWTEPTEKYAKKTLGGRGINSLIMLNEVDPLVRWNDSKNLLCFGVGSLVGTMVPGACRVDISTINVFSGGKGSANVGGFWGPE